MMNLYVLGLSYDYGIVGVFSSRERAEAARAERIKEAEAQWEKHKTDPDSGYNPEFDRDNFFITPTYISKFILDVPDR